MTDEELGFELGREFNKRIKAEYIESFVEDAWNRIAARARELLSREHAETIAGYEELTAELATMRESGRHLLRGALEGIDPQELERIACDKRASFSSGAGKIFLAALKELLPEGDVWWVNALTGERAKKFGPQSTRLYLNRELAAAYCAAEAGIFPVFIPSPEPKTRKVKVQLYLAHQDGKSVYSSIMGPMFTEDKLLREEEWEVEECTQS